MLNRMVIIFLVVLGLATFARAEDKTAFVICKNQKLVRTLRVRPTADGKGCETVYTKDGISKVEGNGQYFEGCLKIMNNIKANLEKGWWKCKDVSNTVKIAE